MRRKLTCLFAVIGFFCVLLIVAFVFINSVVKSGIETAGPQLTGVGVTVGKVSLSPVSGSGSIGGLHLANPEGFKTDAAFRVEEFRIKLDTSTIFSDPIVIDEILVDGAEITWEYAGGGSNLTRILDKLKDVAGEGGDDQGGRKIIIRDFLMKNCSIRIGATVLQGNAKTVPMPTLQLKDIGEKSGGETAAEAALQVMEAVTASARETLQEVPGALKNRGVEIIQEKGKNIGGKISDGVKSLINRVREPKE